MPTVAARPHDEPLAHWPLHRLLQQVTQGRFTLWRGDVYELAYDGRYHHAVSPDPREAELIGQLRRTGLISVGLWLFADVDGRSRETHRLDLSRAGWEILHRWNALRPLSCDRKATAGH